MMTLNYAKEGFLRVFGTSRDGLYISHDEVMHRILRQLDEKSLLLSYCKPEFIIYSEVTDMIVTLCLQIVERSPNLMTEEDTLP